MTKMRFKAAEPSEQPSLGLENIVQMFAKENQAEYDEGYPSFAEYLSCTPKVWDLITQEGNKQMAVASVELSFRVPHLEDEKLTITLDPGEVKHMILALQGTAGRVLRINDKIEDSQTLSLG